ncbi:OLC1v1013050C3 [Oldenlandia corymbosa var. corymbosa]|nr:OLC1v1013050C3 [Oldenlandia corymbosa var. corymbosa]
MASSSLSTSQTYSILNLKNRTRVYTSLPNSSFKPFQSTIKAANLPNDTFKNPSALFNKKQASILPWAENSKALAKAPQFSATTKAAGAAGEENVEEDEMIVSWIDLLPEKIQPYAYLVRLDRPIGTFLFGWPCMWSLALAAEPGMFPDWKMLAFFFFISFWSRNIACTINDYFDKDFDSKVERTKRRPIASGAISGLQALIFLAAQLVLGYAFMLPVNELSRLLWVSSLPLIFTYPLMKRITYWPQAHLGLTANWGALYSWAAIKGTLHPGIVFPLLIGCFFWTLEVDTIYAHQDKTDDVKVGVKSTALLLGDTTKLWTSVFGIASVASFALSGFNANIGWPFYALMVPAAAQIAWQIWAVDLENPADCGRKFRSNKYFGAIVFFAILLGRLFS